MPVRYNDDFKKEVVRACMAGDKSTVEITVPSYTCMTDQLLLLLMADI